MPVARRVLINGLSIGSGGGYTVGRELLRHLAAERPDSTFTLALIEGHTLHEPMRAEALPQNCRLHFAPPQVLGRAARIRYESGTLSEWVREEKINAVLQLNGMIVPAIAAPVLCHSQDPLPYRPEAWRVPTDRVFAFLKRRAHARALRTADCMGWTSAYLRDLVCGRLGMTPRRSEVFYNGVPQAWIDRARTGLPPLQPRPMEVLTVGSVSSYKRQDLVVRALPRLISRPGLEGLTYRMLGACHEGFDDTLRRLARSLGVADRVIIEGRVSDERVTEAMAQARCFVLMSVCESFGIPTVEAMSFGTPVIASNCCAMPEVCGDAADLCPVDDVGALTDRIERVLLDPSHSATLRARGAERVGHFSWQPTAARMAAVLDEIAASRTRAAG
ncbi:MAG TPA: glycosyltransferase family 1 protein [Tepidisphaeraceae bacterium]|jgi:glycosyltransferase involved in cell wall biosynthesis|nr:glycosyltransferase family 1 protein [Tepidisphaeraceae bacterium]